VKELLHEGNITRIIVKDEKGTVLLEIPATIGVIGVVLAPWLAASSGIRNFTVQKVVMTLICNITSKTVTIGDNVTVTGYVYPAVENLTVTVIFIASNSTVKQTAYTNSNGTFVVSWKPDSMELWQVHALIAEDASRSEAYSNSMSFTVTDTWLNQYLLYIIGGVGGVAGVSVVVFIIRRRRYE
jgi:hypothetical protein